jgi:hypothetical protein
MSNSDVMDRIGETPGPGDVNGRVAISQDGALRSPRRFGDERCGSNPVYGISEIGLVLRNHHAPPTGVSSGVERANRDHVRSKQQRNCAGPARCTTRRSCAARIRRPGHLRDANIVAGGAAEDDTGRTG